MFAIVNMEDNTVIDYFSVLFEISKRAPEAHIKKFSSVYGDDLLISFPCYINFRIHNRVPLVKIGLPYFVYEILLWP